jgi:hypothetical protein
MSARSDDGNSRLKDWNPRSLEPYSIRRPRQAEGCSGIFLVRNPARRHYTRPESEKLFAVSISSTQRAWIAVASLVVAAVVGGGVYFLYLRRPLPAPAPSAGPPPDIMSQLLSSGAPVMAYIDVAALRKLQNSPLAAMLGLAGAGPEQDREYQAFVRDTGFDYTRDLDAAAIGMWPTSLLAAKGKLGNNLVLAIADGRFDQQKIEAYALHTGKRGVGFTQVFYTVPGDPPVSFSFLSATQIEMTDTPGMPFVVPVSDKAENDRMRARIERVAGAPIFAAARTDSLPPSFYDAFKNSPQLKTLARSVKGLTLAGQPQGDRIDLALDAECDSLAHAGEIAALLDTFRMLGSVALSDPHTRRQMTKEQAAFLAALASQVKVRHQDTWVRLTLAVTPEMLGLPNPTHAALR